MVNSANAARRRRVGAVPLALAAVLVLVACEPIGDGESADAGTSGAASAAASQPTGEGGQLVIATGGTGGVYYPLGGGLANVIGDTIEGYTATISETNASVDNMLLIQSGGADIAFTLGDTASDAVNGVADFEGDPVDACALGRIYDNFTQLVASSEAGVASVADLAGKRVSLGSPGSGTEVIGLRILEAAGIDPDSGIERQQLGITETVEALRDGTIDAGFWSGGLPTGALTEYATSGEMVIVPTGEHAAAMSDAYGEFYIEDAIPANTYDGQEADVSTVVVPNVLVVNTSTSEDLQRALTALLFEQKDALVAVHPAAEALDPVAAQEVGFMDLCPGSQAYYDEAG